MLHYSWVRFKLDTSTQRRGITMTLDEWLDLEIDGETMHDYQLKKWRNSPKPIGTFINYCIKKFGEWKNEQ